MADTGLPLFDWKQPCTVVAFPLHRRVNKVRKTARAIASSASVRAATDRWWRVLSSLRSQLRQSGLSLKAVDLEVDAFTLAVDQELGRINSPWRMTTTNRGNEKGGAA